MTERKLKKLLYKRPYLVDRTFVLSDAEAEYLLNKHGYPDIEAVVIKARASSTLPYEAWKPFMEALEKRRCAGAKRSSRTIVNAVLLHKKLAVAVLIALLLAGFFGLVPAGRAMAKEIARYIVSLFDNGYTAKSEYSQYDIEPYAEGAAADFKSIHELKAATGLEWGVIAPDSSKYRLDRISYYRDSTEETLFSVYLDENERSIELQQTFALNTEYKGEKNQQEVWHTVIILNGAELNYYIYSADNSYVGVAALEDSWLTVFAAPETDFIDFVSCLCLK